MSKLKQLVTCHPDRKHVALGLCSLCLGANRRREAGIKLRRTSVGRNEEGKICIDCNIFKTWGEFAKCQTNKDGHMAACRECCKARWKNYRTNPVTRKRYLSHLEKKRLQKQGCNYNEMFEKQNGKCVLCDEFPYPGKRLIIEHDHETKKVRGLAHQKCNTIIGMVENYPDLIEKTQEYLRRHKNESRA